MTNKKKRTFLRVLSTTAALSMFFTTVVASAHGEDVKRDYHPLTVNENGAEKIDKADLVTKEAEFNYNKAKEIFKVTFDKEKKKQEDTSKLRRKDKTGRYTQDEVRKWALSMHHKAVDVDGAFGAQCVDLIMDMYNKFGAYRVGGNAIDYASNHLPKNWTRYKKGETSVKPGDILVWHWGPGDIYGHVDIAVSVKDGKIQTIGQNVGTDGSGGPGVITSRTDANLVAIIRPPYVEYDDELKDYAEFKTAVQNCIKHKVFEERNDLAHEYNEYNYDNLLKVRELVKEKLLPKFIKAFKKFNTNKEIEEFVIIGRLETEYNKVDIKRKKYYTYYIVDEENNEFPAFSENKYEQNKTYKLSCNKLMLKGNEYYRIVSAT